MLAIIFALISYVGWGVGDVVGMVGGRKLGAIRATYWWYLFRLVLYLLIAPFFVYQLRNGTIAMVLFGIALGALSSLGIVSFYKAANLTNPSMVGAVSGSWGVISMLISVFLFGEMLRLNQVVAIIFITIGVILTALDFSARDKRRMVNRGLLWAMLACLLWGLVGAYIKYPSQTIGWFWTTLFLAVPSTVVGSIYQFSKRSFETDRIIRNWKIVAAGSLLGAVGDMAYNIGVSFGLVAVVAPIAGSYATLSVFVASYIFREPMNGRQRMGVAATLIGIVWLSFVSA